MQTATYDRHQGESIKIPFIKASRSSSDKLTNPRFKRKMSLISALFLTPAYARALRPLSDHRHDHRNPQPFVYRRAPAYGLMVILVVCLWHESNSQLFDTEAAQTDGNQMPFIACLHHLCVPVTSVMNAAGTESCLSRSF